MAKYKREVPQMVERHEGLALTGSWQVKLRRVRQWVLNFGDDSWTDPELAAFYKVLRATERPLYSSATVVDVEQVNAVYDRAIKLGYPGETI